jgi:peptide/nickel transport system permease protein
MIRFALHRTGVGLVQIFVALSIIFIAVRAVPGDPAVVLATGAGGTADVNPETLEQIRQSMGLDKPFLVQYFDYLKGVLVGNLGQSFQDHSSVATTLAQRLPNTVEIVVLAALLGVLVGVAVGSWVGRGRHIVQLLGAGLISLGISVPVYILGSLLVLVFALNLGWFPTGGYADLATDFVGHLQRLVLPAVALSAAFAAVVARMTASSVREVARQDWVRTARSIGLGPRRVFQEDVLRNALNPVVTVVGLQVGSLLGGTVLVERIFNWPGIGSLLVNAIAQRDYPVVQGVVVVVSIIFIAINIVVDIAYGLLDPRVGKA